MSLLFLAANLEDPLENKKTGNPYPHNLLMNINSYAAYTLS